MNPLEMLSCMNKIVSKNFHRNFLKSYQSYKIAFYQTLNWSDNRVNQALLKGIFPPNKLQLINLCINLQLSAPK